MFSGSEANSRPGYDLDKQSKWTTTLHSTKCCTRELPARFCSSALVCFTTSSFFSPTNPRSKLSRTKRRYNSKPQHRSDNKLHIRTIQLTKPRTFRHAK